VGSAEAEANLRYLEEGGAETGYVEPEGEQA
jgi:hypothetical protein